MKKILSAFLVVILCLGLCACGESDLPPIPTLQPEEPAEAEPSEAAVTVAPAELPDAPESGRITVSVGRTVREAYDPENGTKMILSFSYETPNIVIEGNEAAAKSVNEFIALLDETYYTGEDYGEGPGTGYNNMLTLAEDNYMYVRQNNLEGARLDMVSDRSVRVIRADDGLICLLYNDYLDLGGVHGEYNYTGYCFDTASGELLTLDTISPDPEALRAFLTDRLVTLAGEDPDIRERIDGFVEPDALEETLAALVREGSWYFDGEGMTVFSDLYEISSYAAGVVEFRIPYTDLLGKIDAKYIPTAASANGSFYVFRAEELNEGSMEIIGMVKAADGGENICIAADGTLTDVRISRVEYSGIFYETEQLWYCSEMSDCALQLMTVIPEGMPDLQISFHTADGEKHLYLTESGEDGSLILADDSIEAVG